MPYSTSGGEEFGIDGMERLLVHKSRWTLVFKAPIDSLYFFSTKPVKIFWLESAGVSYQLSVVITTTTLTLWSRRDAW